MFHNSLDKEKLCKDEDLKLYKLEVGDIITRMPGLGSYKFEER